MLNDDLDKMADAFLAEIIQPRSWPTPDLRGDKSRAFARAVAEAVNNAWRDRLLTKFSEIIWSGKPADVEAMILDTTIEMLLERGDKPKEGKAHE
jgi:hypothetical protein